MDVQTVYQKAILFAAAKHTAANQTVPGTKLPYVIHISNVAMEILTAAQHSTDFNAALAVQLALLHDTVEDTDTKVEELEIEFGAEVANGVLALTKNNELPKDERMTDSLTRIKALAKEVWAVKLADRITNLQQPPSYWTREKIASYRLEAIEILHELKGGNLYLEKRLQEKIIAYETYL